VRALKFDQPFEIKAQNPCNPWEWRPQNHSSTRRSDHKLWKRKWVFLRQKNGSNNLEKLCHALNTIKPHQRLKLRNRLNDESVLWLSCFSIINIIAKLLDLLKNLLINGTGTTSSDFTMILSFYCSKSHSFQIPKKNRFSRAFFSATRNPGFLILPPIRNTSFQCQIQDCRM